MLSQIMVNGLPDTARFTELVSGLIMRAKNAAGGEDSELAIFGELVAVLWADGNAHAAIRLEQLWNEAAKSHHFSLRCGYPITGFYRQEHSDAFLKICAEHSAVIPSEPYTDLKTEARRLENIAHLQQKAHALESEKSLRRLSLHLLRTQDEERRRIGRELHDSLGQYLSVLKMKLDSVNRSGDKTSVDLIRQDVAECAKLAEEAIKEVRTISYLLYPPMLEEMGLKSAVPWYLDGFSKRSGIKTTFQIPSDFPRLSPEIELAMFRVLQESLTNVHRHSGSPSADVRLLLQNGVAVLAVTDKGKGFPEAILEENKQDWMGTPGVGLRGMTERLRQLGGTLELSSTSKGTTVRASVPMDAAAAPADSQFNLGLESSNTLNSK